MVRMEECGGGSGRSAWFDSTHEIVHSNHSTGCLDLRVKLAGKELLLDKGWHDPPHYLTRLKEWAAVEAAVEVQKRG